MNTFFFVGGGKGTLVKVSVGGSTIFDLLVNHSPDPPRN